MSVFFNNRAQVYDVRHIEAIDGGIESKQIIASFLPNHTKMIIDFGIGTGLELEEIFKRFPNVEITGIDIAENMLQLLKKRYSNKSINLYCGNYLEYNFGNNSYDVALSVMTFHHYKHEEKIKLYKKIYDYIKHNGIYIECDYMLSEHEFDNAQEMEDFYFSEYERLKKEQGIIDNREYHYDIPCTVSNQMKLLHKAGFTNVQEIWRRKNTVILIATK
jgi:tRNA (cmo5U34)-methyltransferase